MSFQEFASKLFGGRDELEERVKASRKVKNADTGGPFSGSSLSEVVGEDTIRKDNQLERVQEEFSETQGDGITGTVPEWLAEKKLSRNAVKDSKVEDDVVISGDLEAETDDAVLIEDDDAATEKWFPKSKFEQLDGGPNLSESKEQKAENVMESRSERAQRTDRRNAAPIAEDFEEWEDDPSETDLPGIDTLGSGDDLDDVL